MNKVNTKVILKFDVGKSEILTEDEKEVVYKALESKLTNDRVLLLAAQDKRSQLQNKEAVILKFDRLLEKAFTKKKARKATKPSKASVNDRITGKKKLSEKKKWRQNPND